MVSEHDDEILHRELERDGEEPAVQIVEIVAELEDEEPTHLNQIWDCIDGMLDEVFDNPPAPEAQVEVTFSYEGYRVTVEQNGSVRFVRVG